MTENKDSQYNQPRPQPQYKFCVKPELKNVRVQVCRRCGSVLYPTNMRMHKVDIPGWKCRECLLSRISAIASITIDTLHLQDLWPRDYEEASRMSLRDENNVYNNDRRNPWLSSEISHV